jgi:hypothetical protein
MAHTHRYVPSPSDSITHVRCEICGFRVTHEQLIRGGHGNLAPTCWWTNLGIVFDSIARREAFRATGAKIKGRGFSP